MSLHNMTRVNDYKNLFLPNCMEYDNEVYCVIISNTSSSFLLFFFSHTRRYYIRCRGHYHWDCLSRHVDQLPHSPTRCPQGNFPARQSFIPRPQRRHIFSQWTFLPNNLLAAVNIAWPIRSPRPYTPWSSALKTLLKDKVCVPSITKYVRQLKETSFLWWMFLGKVLHRIEFR